MGFVVTGQAIPMRSGVCLMARITGNLGVPITQATLSTIQYALTDLGNPQGVTVVTGALVPLVISQVVFDQLQQNDSRWTKDSAAAPDRNGNWGYNFLAVLPASLFTSANRQHVDVKFTPVSGEVFYFQAEWTPLVGYA